MLTLFFKFQIIQIIYIVYYFMNKIKLFWNNVLDILNLNFLLLISHLLIAFFNFKLFKLFISFIILWIKLNYFETIFWIF